MTNKKMKHNDYYIKLIYGPAGQSGYPCNKDGCERLIHFAKGQKNRCEVFSKCKGFLLYETGHRNQDKIGAKSIYAYGIISQTRIIDDLVMSREPQNKSFPFAVKVKINKRVNPKDGILLNAARKIIRRKNMQAPGGLIPITEKQFEELHRKLDKC